MKFIGVLIDYIFAILALIGVLVLLCLYFKWERYYDGWQATHHFVKDYPDEKDGIIGKINWKLNLLKDFWSKEKMYNFLFLKKFFPPKEVKIALGMLDVAEYDFYNRDCQSTRGHIERNGVFQLVRGHIEKILFAHSNVFSEKIRQGASPRHWVYRTIANVAGDLVESGNYHIYRGVLNSMEPGEELVEIFDMAVDKLVEMRVLDTEQAKKEKGELRENIKSIG
ncbi:hypothetical protein ES708_31336 [subsurface metagenome]